MGKGDIKAVFEFNKYLTSALKQAATGLYSITMMEGIAVKSSEIEKGRWYPS
jgi:hypothetical protein